MYRGKVKIITDDEFNHLSSQIVTSNDNLNLKSQNATIEGRRGQRRKYLPYAFTPKQWVEKTNAIGFVSKTGFEGELKEDEQLNALIAENLKMVKLDD